MADPPRLPKQFNATRWSLVVQARGEGAEARRALEDLCQTYWFPLYAWCRRFGLPAADAEDMVQGFFVKILSKRLFDVADASRGKLRTFLLTALQHHVRDEHAKSRTERRGGGRVVSFDSAEAESWLAGKEIEGESADHLFDRQWALTVLDNAIGTLEKRATAGGKAVEFECLRPFLTNEGSAVDYQKSGETIGVSAGSFKVAVHRLRTKFRDALRAEVADTQPEGASVDEEIGYLMQILRGI